MSQGSRSASDALAAAEQARLKSFQAPLQPRAIAQAVSTFGLYLLLTAAMYALAKISFWATLALAIPASGLMVRIFVFQHDTGHNSFFALPWQNRALGHLCSLVTLTPFAYWRRQHIRHHAGWNNLDHRGIMTNFYSDCLTVREYAALGRLARLGYRISHHPAVTHLILPPVIFILLHRLPLDMPASYARERRGVYALNLAVLLVFGALVYFFGVKTVLLVHLPAMVLAAIIGVWLFSVQHRFEDAKWFGRPEWTLARGALQGTSYLKLPRLLRWFSADIGAHHVHHLRPGIPNYRLVDCHEACPDMMAGVSVLTFRAALKASSYALWDEGRHCMVPFPA